MSDFQESNTNDDFDDELDEEEESLLPEDVGDPTSDNLDVGLPSNIINQYTPKIITNTQTYEKLFKEEYETTNLLTKYEKARILGMRSEQIAEGGPVFVDRGDLMSPIMIAKKELYNKKVPWMIERPLPSKDPRKPRSEVRRVSDLIIMEPLTYGS